jgi:hypothetical protein
LSSPLTNIESLYLSELSFNSLPDTISQAYGSNFLVLEPRVWGLAQHADDRFRITIQVPSGNYSTPTSLIEEANRSIQSLATTSVLDFGNTSLAINAVDGMTSFRIDLGINFHQTSFQLQWFNNQVRDGLGFSDLQSLHSFASIHTEYPRYVNAANDASNSIFVNDGRLRIRFFVGPDSLTPAWEHTLALLTPNAIYNVHTFLSTIQENLQQDDIFGTYSSFQVTNQVDSSRIFTFFFQPDVVNHRDLFSPWWNSLSTCRAGGVRMECTFLDAADRANLWFGNRSVCGFVPTQGSEVDLSLEADTVVWPHIVTAMNRYQSMAYQTEAASSPPEDYATFSNQERESLLYHGNTTSLDYWLRTADNLLVRVDETLQTVQTVSAAILFQATNRNYSWIDECIEIPAGQQFTLSRFLQVLQSLFQENKRMSKSAIELSETDPSRLLLKADYAWTLEGNSCLHSIILINLDDSLPNSVGAHFDQISSSVAPFRLSTRGGIILNSFYQIGKFRIEAIPQTGFPDAMGASLVIEDYTIYTDFNLMLRSLNSQIRNARDEEFGNMWASSVVEITGFVPNATLQQSEVVLTMKAEMNKIFTESNFTMTCVGSSLWSAWVFCPECRFPWPIMRCKNATISERSSDNAPMF